MGDDSRRVEVCIYGGTASGIAAAVAIARANRSVLIVEPSKWLGGMPGGGIGVLRDCLYANDVGGIARTWMEKERAIGCNYQTHHNQAEIRRLWIEFAAEHGIEIIYEHRLGRVEKQRQKIQELSLDYAPGEPDGCPSAIPAKTDAMRISADLYVDAGYEGDLLAAAEVSYAVGRESRDTFDESLAGQRNLIEFDISPYEKPDDPGSGLLPMIDTESFSEGAASRHINAYNFRLWWADEGTPIPEPEYIDQQLFVLVRRALKENPGLISWPHDNYQRNNMISGGIPGRQSGYPDGDWTERSAIWREWIEYVKTMNVLTGNKKGLRRGEYPDTDDFPTSLYVRQGRRMAGRYIMTQHDLMLQTDITNPVGLAYHPVDIYPPRLVATSNGKVASEGETMIMASPGPFQIPYESLTPKKEECTNLLVSVCMSASHAAMAAVRIEVTYMIMGEAAGIAAVRALTEASAVQDISMPRLRNDLTKAGIILAWDGTSYGDDFVNRTSIYAERALWWERPEDYTNRSYKEIWKGERDRGAMWLPLRTDPWV